MKDVAVGAIRGLAAAVDVGVGVDGIFGQVGAQADQGGEARWPLIVPLQELLPEVETAALADGLADLLRRYAATLQPDRRHLLGQYRLVELARKVVGVGSVGTRAWIGLLVGRDGRDPLFLQLKEAQASVLERFAGKSPYRRHGQRLMQAASDIFLGWEQVTGLGGG